MDLDRTLAVVPLFVIAGLVVIAWLMDWGRDSDRRAVLVLGVVAALVALAGNQLLGHFYYRPRPFLVLDVHRIIPHSRETSMYSDHTAVAGALTASLLAARRWWLGAAAVLLTIAVGIARVGAAIHYPSDVAAGAAAGAVALLVLLPLKRFASRPVAGLMSVERRLYARQA